MNGPGAAKLDSLMPLASVSLTVKREEDTYGTRFP